MSLGPILWTIVFTVFLGVMVIFEMRSAKKFKKRERAIAFQIDRVGEFASKQARKNGVVTNEIKRNKS